MDFPAGVMVTVLTATAVVDKYGDSDGAAPTESSWGPCAVAPRTSVEREDARTPAVVTGWTVYGPAEGAPTSAADRLRIDGVVYEIDGLPGVWSNPFTGWAPGVEVAVSRASAS